jgi:ubiquinone/menaquinone biosynthesis C-methylase UbiE
MRKLQTIPDLFNGIANSYDTWAQLLTFFQYLSWRKFLVSQMTLQPDHTVLDVATGTAGVALEIAFRKTVRLWLFLKLSG